MSPSVAPQPEPLHTSPAAADAATRAALLAAFLAPAAVILLVGLRELLAPEGAAPSVALSLLPGLFWLGLALRRGWRALGIDIGRLLLARASFPLLLACSLVGGLVALSGSGGVLAQALEAWLVLLTLAKALQLAATDRARLKKQCVLVALQALLLVAADWPIRRFVLPGKSHNNIFTEYEPVLGWKLRPNASNERRNDLYVSRETVNELGFRTPLVPFEKPAGTRRVLVLGDSHSEAYTVDDAQTWCTLLQARLSRPERPVQVISLGVGGYSTDQELLCYLRYGRRFQPDLVLLQTCSNDPEGNAQDHYWRGKKPVFERHGETLLLTGVPVPDLRNTGLLSRDFLKRSALLVLLESMLRQVAIEREREVEIDPAEALHTTELLIRDLAGLVRADGLELLAFNANTRDQPEFERELRAILARQGIPYLETDAMYAEPFEGYWYAGHWNQKGQEAAADILAPQLASRLEATLVPTR